MFNCSDEDIILSSDVDEIPNPEYLSRLNEYFEKDLLYTFNQSKYCYALNLLFKSHNDNTSYNRVQNYNWKGSRMGSYNIIKNYSTNLLRNQDNNDLVNSGWHFSYCLSIEKILEKIRFYSHSERNNEVAVTKEHIENCILNKTDIWNGKYNYAQKSNKLINFSIDKLPKYIQNNIKRFENYLDL